MKVFNKNIYPTAPLDYHERLSVDMFTALGAAPVPQEIHGTQLGMQLGGRVLV